MQQKGPRKHGDKVNSMGVDHSSIGTGDLHTIGNIYNRAILWYFSIRMSGKPTIEMGFYLLVIQPSYGLHYRVTLEQVEATGAPSTSLDRYKYHQKHLSMDRFL